MSFLDSVIKGYEDTRLLDYKDIGEDFPNSHYYDQLHDMALSGVLKANQYVNGRLLQTYSVRENHVGVVAATRLGKTTSYVIPTILSFAKQKKKRSMVISDPKGELYKLTSATLKKEGYRIRLLNFRDYEHSECWNPITPIYKMYVKAISIADEVQCVPTENGMRNVFRGKIYESQRELDDVIKRCTKIALADVANEIDHFAAMTVPTEDMRQPYWEDSARDFFKAGLWAMLEDITPFSPDIEPITEDTFSIGTMLSIFSTFPMGNGRDFLDHGYFTKRPRDSRAYNLAYMSVIQNGDVTRKCIISTFNSKVTIYRNSTIRMITGCNSFKEEELNDGVPTAFFIDYQDEIKTHYKLISTFVQSAYKYLINCANCSPYGKLDYPFYFILDEFGNFPPIPDFEIVISACGGRNIYFILILQSYAQLENVYGREVAEIIRDNLNMHVFIGSNNPETLQAFSRECGEWTRISPMSALNGDRDEISTYQIETIPRVPKSLLSRLKEGECIVTEANCGYVLFSKLERYFRCKEFADLPVADNKEYHAAVNALDDRFDYKLNFVDDDDD